MDVTSELNERSRSGSIQSMPLSEINPNTPHRSPRSISDSGEDLSNDDRAKYNVLINEARSQVRIGHVDVAVKLNQKALKICYSEKLAKKIKKMEEYLKTCEEESSDDESGMVHMGKGFYIYKELHKQLYSHQQDGVLWLWSLFRKKKGGILGDDMGLGKTIQVIAFLSGMYDMEKIKTVLIVLPVAVMVNWENEFNKWTPGLKVAAYHGTSKRERERALTRIQRRGGICLTTYGLVVTSWEELSQQDGREFTWDYMILDEGHKIKNPTKTSKSVHAIPACHRIILTGTPVQNNLRELWALFDFVHQGTLLGTVRTFKLEYEGPITRARERDAKPGEKKLGIEMAESLKNIIAPYFLRRTKGEVNRSEKRSNKEDITNTKTKAAHAKMPDMTRKNDLIVWTFLSQAQERIYQDFLSLDSVKELLMTSKSPLVALTILKKICDHPRLLSTRACSQLGIHADDGIDDEMLETEEGNQCAATRIQHIDDDILVKESGKMVLLMTLLDQLRSEGHKCLVFSQSRKMLDIMQKVMTNRGHRVMRLDGTIAKVEDREARIQKFQSDKSINVFLLTTQVGGVGLTLTAANRVVIYDPSWNPATDAQAVDRAFRIGQARNVVIYRLITCGTVEEKIYRRQIFKNSITQQTTGNSKNPYRYFSKFELRELFTLDDPQSSTTQQQLEQLHGGQRNTDCTLDDHIAFLHSLNMFGISDHDLMFSQGDDAGDHQEDEIEDIPGMMGAHGVQNDDYIQERVRKAREIITIESSQTTSYQERTGTNKQYPTQQRTQTSNWDLPKPSVKSEDDVVPMPVKLEANTSIQSESSSTSEAHIDLTQDVSMTSEEDAIDLTSPCKPFRNTNHEDEDELPDIKIQEEEEEEEECDEMEQSFATMHIDLEEKPIKVERKDSDSDYQHNNLVSNPPSTKPEIPSHGRMDTTIFLDSPVFVKEESCSEMDSSISNVLCDDSVGHDTSSQGNSVLEESVMHTEEDEAVVGESDLEESEVEDSLINTTQNYSMSLKDEERVVITSDTEADTVDQVYHNDGKGWKEDFELEAVHINDSPMKSPVRKRSRKSISARRRIIDSSEDEDEEDGAEEEEEKEEEKEAEEEYEEDSCDNKTEDNRDEVDEVDCEDKEEREDKRYIDKDVLEEEDVQEDHSEGFSEDEEEGLEEEENEKDPCFVDGEVEEGLGEEEEHAGEEEDVGEDGEEAEDEQGRESEADMVEDEESLNGFGLLSEEDQMQYNQLVDTARVLCKERQYEDALSHVLQALELYQDPELQVHALKIQKKIMKR